MDTNDLIRQAFDTGGGVVSGDDLFVLEGNVKLNELKITPIQEFYTANIVHFATNSLHDSVMLGIFNSRDAAEEYGIYIRTMIKDANGNIIN